MRALLIDTYGVEATTRLFSASIIQAVRAMPPGRVLAVDVHPPRYSLTLSYLPPGVRDPHDQEDGHLVYYIRRGQYASPVALIAAMQAWGLQLRAEQERARGYLIAQEMDRGAALRSGTKAPPLVRPDVRDTPGSHGWSLIQWLSDHLRHWFMLSGAQGDPLTGPADNASPADNPS